MRSITVFVAAFVCASASAQVRLKPDSLFFSFPNHTQNADSLVDVIVEFTEAPLFMTSPAAFRVSASPPTIYTERFSQFSADIAAFLPASAGIAANHPNRHFYKSFFGTAVRLPKGSLASIEALPYVKKIHQNSRVRAFLDKSVSKVRADKVWTDLGTQGEGILVGIIDTGVDYLLPALGGGIGDTFKVVGGYDFVNGDEDPMDDEGHGTHVAGIVAAESDSMRGVAPKVKLYAFKVLDEEGDGSMADVIAAIERTVDPNDDGDPADKLDVVNMSLGAFGGNPDDAASTAVDNATKLGVAFCIAAGNAGYPTPVEGKDDNYYYDGSETIGSPGTSRLAITVGAVNDNDSLANFSSKGPAQMTFGIKPDVTAPGVDIASLAIGSGTVELSGTSMAAPHVSGIAALLKSLHPSWSPGEIKSAIVTTAEDLSEGPMKQGAGRADAFRAATVTTFLSPTNLSYALDDPSQSVWVKAETLTVTNRNGSSQIYNVSAPGLPAGVTMTLNPSTFTLPSNGSQALVVSVWVSNSVVPIVKGDIEIYGGQVFIKGSVDTVHAPWAFVRTSRLVLTFDEPYASFVGGSNEAFFISDYFGWMIKSRRLSAYQAEVLGLPGGTYDVGAFFASSEGVSKFVTKEQVSVPETGGTMPVSAAAATHTLGFGGVDEVGSGLATYRNSMRAFSAYFPNGVWTTNYLPEQSTGLVVSPTSNRVTFHGVQAVADYAVSHRLYIPQFDSWSGMSGDVTLTNDPAAYVHQTLRFAIPPGHPQSKVLTELFVMETTEGVDQGVGNIYMLDTASVEDGAVTFEAYVAPEAGPKYSLAVSFFLGYSDIASPFADVNALYFTARNDSLFNAVETLQDESTFGSADGDTLTINASPPHLVYVPYHNSFGPGTIQFLVNARSPLGEFKYDDLLTGTYSITNNEGGVVATGSLGDGRGPIEVPVGVYTTELTTSNHYINGIKGTVVSRHRYDLSQPFPAPPSVTLFRLLDSRGKMTSTLRLNDSASIRFGFKVIGPGPGFPVADSTHAFFRVHGAEAWTPAPVQKIADLDRPGSYFSADLSASTLEDSVAIDLRLTSADVDGNTTELLVLPAFAVGDWQGQIPTVVEPPPSNVPVTFALYANFPNPFNPGTTIRFDVPVETHVTLTVYNMLGQRVARLVDEKRGAGRYEVAWDASRFSSGMYFYRLDAGTFSSTKRMVLLK